LFFRRVRRSGGRSWVGGQRGCFTACIVDREPSIHNASTVFFDNGGWKSQDFKMLFCSEKLTGSNTEEHSTRGKGRGPVLRLGCVRTQALSINHVFQKAMSRERGLHELIRRVRFSTAVLGGASAIATRSTPCCTRSIVPSRHSRTRRRDENYLSCVIKSRFAF
jgi:hypothetical protein